MAKVSGRRGEHRHGFGVSLYLTNEAADLLARVADATRRSQSEVVSLLVETYGPGLLAGKEPGREGAA